MYYGEKLNSITHLVGTSLAMMGFPILLIVSIQADNLLLLISFIVFGITLILLYTMSTLYHSFRSAKVKKVFQKFDHIAIYLLIAGTYTPYMLVSLWEHDGLFILMLIWALAVIGILLDVLISKRIEWLQLLIYLTMGLICIVRFSELQAALPTIGLICLVLGGMAYIIGIVFYVLDEMQKLRHSHGIWHLFVLTGSILHFISIIGYVR